jgi:hypothetical protein
MKKIIMFLLIILSLFILIGCEMNTLSLKEFNDNPKDYLGKEITIRGKITKVIYPLTGDPNIDEYKVFSDDEGYAINVVAGSRSFTEDGQTYYTITGQVRYNNRGDNAGDYYLLLNYPKDSVITGTNLN